MRTFSSRRRKSQREKTRPFGELSIDTQCTAPNKTLSSVQGLSFVSFEQSKARKRLHAAAKDEQLAAVTGIDFRQAVHKRGTIHGHVRTGTLEFVASDPGLAPAQDTLKLPTGLRAKGLRPSPLDISPCDRAITIGCAFSPAKVSSHTQSPPSAVNASRSPPTIVVTPAKDQFSPSELSQYGGHHHSGYRPASSVYSRNTACVPQTMDQNAPPVPPLPLFINTSHARISVGTAFEEDLTPSCSGSAGRSAHPSRSLTPGLPTPRRSKGWWNVITSPFSARSTNGAFWRWPSLAEDCVPVLVNAEVMAKSNPHAGVIFTVRAPGDEALRTAPAFGPQSEPEIQQNFRPLPIRPGTAPGALDANIPSVNIYRIPSQGEAAAYYNPEQHFSSPCLVFNESPENTLNGWSPSHSVYMPDHCSDVVVRQQSSTGKDADQSPIENTAKTASRPAAAQSKSPPVVCFSTPSEDELKSAGLPHPQNERSFTQTTGFSLKSPMSATPVVQDAHLARFVGPQSSFGEQKKVEVERTPVPAAGPPLAGATISHREEYRGEWSVLLSEKTARHVQHTRENSYGLGISDGDRELYPEPPRITGKVSGQSRSEECTIRTVKEHKPRRPWYRRFFWLLIAFVSALLVVLIVMLAVFVPRKQSGMAIEATWVNGTGFPNLSIGIMTVVQPTRTHMQSSCVAPSDLWKCADPATSNPPNFRLEITFRADKLPKNETSRDDTTTRSRLLRRDPLASPPVPSQADQIFMGRTTDNTSLPYNGEETPFYISFLDPVALPTDPSSQTKRDSTNTSPPISKRRTTTTTNAASTKPPLKIPSPAVKPNGQPSDPILYPLVTAQPLRLFNRGLESEYYGFYTYFDQSLLISGVPTKNSSSTNVITSNIPLANASGICTWSQTRILVRIWTNKGFFTTFLPPSSPPPTKQNKNASVVLVDAENSTANITSSPPGSFPFPVTLTIDRHGGSSDEKGVYCYGIENSRVIGNGKLWIEEDRAAGSGSSGLIHPADIPGNDDSTTTTTSHKRESSDDDDDDDDEDDDVGGIDGGYGGCSCEWQNWT